MRSSIISFVILLVICLSLYGKEAWVNHNAVLICGDTPDLQSKSGEKNWNGGVNYQWIYDEFWNDTYLMYELLWENECYKLYGTPPLTDHIWVLYGDGNDYECRGYRYNPQQRLQINKITDYGAYYDSVAFVFNLLAGSMRPDKDNFFCWTFDHGSSSGGHAYLCLMDRSMRDDDFANRVNQIQAKTKVFWMQQCFSGGFIDDLHAPNTVILTAAAANEYAYRADNVSRFGSPLPENETYHDTTYHHGEFNFHTMNAVRGTAIYPYDDPPEVNADYNGDLLISMYEAYRLANWWNSTPSHFQYSDDGNIGASTFLGYDDYIEPDAPTGLQCDSVTFVESPEPADVSILAQPPYALVWLSWDPNTEADLVGYYIYRKEANGTWTWRGGSKSNSYCDIADIGKTYYYYVTAVDIAKNESDASNIITVYTYIPGYGGGFAANEQPTLNLTVRTNPVRDIAVIELNVPRSGDGILTLYNTMGERVRTIRCKVEPGHKVLKLDVTDLPAGVYFLKLIFGGERMFKKLTVFH